MKVRAQGGPLNGQILTIPKLMPILEVVSDSEAGKESGLVHRYELQKLDRNQGWRFLHLGAQVKVVPGLQSIAKPVEV